MASALVYIELEEGAPTGASLACLNVGREVATRYGASLYAVVLCAQPPGYGDDDVVAVLSRHGADKVVLVTNERLAAPALHATHGPALQAACEQFPPQLVLLPNSAGGRDIGPRLALELAGFFIGSVSLDTDPPGDDLMLRRTLFRRRLEGRLALPAAERPLVLCLDTHDRPPAEVGDDEAEVVVLQAPTPDVMPLSLDAVQPTPLPCGPRLVIGGGAGLESADFRRLERLATILGGEVVASHRAVAAGLVEAPKVGLDGRPLPEGALYLAFGVSGSERHLAALAPDTRVIAVNSDAQAPIFSFADVGLVAEAGPVLRDLVEALDPNSAEEE